MTRASVVIGGLLVALAACEEARPPTASVEVKAVPKGHEDPQHPCPPGATQMRRESNGVVTFSCDDGKPAEDPRLPCPPGTTQQRRESEFERGVVTLWCEDADEVFQGPRRKWWPNGQLRMDMPYRDGVPEGVSQTWYPDGKLECRRPHRDGRLDGLVRCWHPNGKVEHETRFEMDRAVGIGKWWDERGRLVKTRNYAKDPLPIPDTDPFPIVNGKPVIPGSR